MFDKDFEYDPISVTKIRVNEETHIKLKNKKDCNECQDKPCTYICPSQVYEWKKTQMSVDYPRCVECGACVLACPKNNLDWNYPPGGWGAIFTHG